MEHYSVIDRIEIREIPEAKTLNMAFYRGMPFAVSKEFNKNDLYVIFLPDGQISEEYAEANDCIERRDPETGNRAGGFFGRNRKVRAVKFMQGKIRSVGYIAHLDSLSFTGANLNKIEPGTYFSELNGIPISQKFEIKKQQSLKSITQNKARKSKNIIGFPEHYDTSQFYRTYPNAIMPGDIVTVTEKLDGTSVRAGNVIEIRQLRWYEKILDKLVKVDKAKSIFVTGTRRVVLSDKGRETSFYENDNIYQGQTEFLRERLPIGESFYGEIVGWVDNERPLFNRGGVIFKYNAAPGERKFYVYNIKRSLPNGETMDLSWNAVKIRANEVGALVVPELIKSFIATEEFCKPENIEKFYNEMIELSKGPSTIDPEHIREGVVIRIDRGLRSYFHKVKSEEFYALEDKFKNNENNVDIEEIS